jgi:hypothetical protein
MKSLKANRSETHCCATLCSAVEHSKYDTLYSTASNTATAKTSRLRKDDGGTRWNNAIMRGANSTHKPSPLSAPQGVEIALWQSH